MSRDRHERKHRRTHRHPESVKFMASADFDAVPPLADVLAKNFVAKVNGHEIYRGPDGVLCDIWTRGVGWWGFGLTEDGARRNCEIVAVPDLKPVYGTE